MDPAGPSSLAAKPLSPTRRFFGALATWGLLFVATPGLLAPDGLWFVAFVALVPWALVASRPGRFAYAAEWLAAAIGISTICFWSTYVIWLTLLAVALVPAVYMSLAGVVLRRTARAFPLALAVPSAWIALETLCMLVEPPLGFSWMRLGHHASGETWLAGSARVFGTAGVGWAMAAVAGGIADVLRARAAKRTLERPRFVALAALGPVVLVLAFANLTSAPSSRPGPRVLLVQPGWEQARKMVGQTNDEMMRDLVHLTRKGMAEAQRANEPPDIVAWGETCLLFPVCAPDLLAAWDRGVRPVPWAPKFFDRAFVETMRGNERILVGETVYGSNGREPILPPGTAFVSGAEHFVVEDGVIRRQNAVLAWQSPGVRVGTASKVHLVPGGETMSGLERFSWIRDTANRLAGYVPDLVDGDRTQVLAVQGRDGRSWRFGATVCFDNVFEGPYVEPLRREQVDFHLVASNEAWYRTSWEYDQMMAFSRMVAIETGRSMVRATNAGISAVIGPDGREVARLSVGGRDRMVPGSLRVVVPVPLVPPEGERAPRPLYVATAPWWNVLWLGLGLGLVLAARHRRARSA